MLGLLMEQNDQLPGAEEKSWTPGQMESSWTEPALGRAHKKKKKKKKKKKSINQSIRLFQTTRSIH